MAILVIAEHDNKNLLPSTLTTLGAAKELGKATVLVAGKDCKAVAEAAAKADGVEKVLLAEADYYEYPLAENLAPLIADLAKDYSHVLAPASTFGKNVMPCAAAILDVQQISDIAGIEDEETFIRPIYAGNAMATVKSSDEIKLITVRGAAFDAVEAEGGDASVETIDPAEDTELAKFKGQELSKSDRPELTQARVIISGGRGMGSADNFKIIEAVADKLGAAIGASRAAVDSGFRSNEFQVGQTGKIVAPELYIAVGISGAIQHLAGMKDSKVIVAINKDEDAPIFSVADYGLVADLFEAVPELEKELDKVL